MALLKSLKPKPTHLIRTLILDIHGNLFIYFGWIKMKRYQGSCHCGTVKFQATIDIEECYVCDCSICSRKGSIMNRVISGDFQILEGKSALTTYKFNKGIASHYFCGRCGIHTFHNPRTAPELYSVNVRCMPEVNIQDIRPKQVFGSELD